MAESIDTLIRSMIDSAVSQALDDFDVSGPVEDALRDSNVVTEDTFDDLFNDALSNADVPDGDSLRETADEAVEDYMRDSEYLTADSLGEALENQDVVTEDRFSELLGDQDVVYGDDLDRKVEEAVEAALAEAKDASPPTTAEVDDDVTRLLERVRMLESTLARLLDVAYSVGIALNDTPPTPINWHAPSER